METLVLAGVSVRAMAQAAVRDGFAVLALDAFGDVDTQACARAWRPIGTGPALRVDGQALCAALDDAARDDGVAGWIAGTGFEGRDTLLADGARRLPLLGCPPATWAAVREPRRFFGTLDTLGLPHPAWQPEPPSAPQGWLAKDLHSAGGWHVRPARRREAAAGAGRFFQRRAAGVPMSATLLAGGGQVQVLGLNRQLTTALLGRPFVFRGVVGPLPLAPALAAAVEAAAVALGRHVGLRGLASLDLLVDGDSSFTVLELNPRPPASLSLYPGAMAAHVAACRGEALAPPSAAGVRGLAHVFAPRELHVDDLLAAALQAAPHHHDLPRAGTRLRRGDPLCSVSAEAADADACEALLRQRVDALERTLPETSP